MAATAGATPSSHLLLSSSRHVAASPQPRILFPSLSGKRVAVGKNHHATGVRCMAVAADATAETKPAAKKKSGYELQTLTSWLLRQEMKGEIDTELTIVMSSIAMACKQIASLVQRAGISNLTGVQGAVNIQGEDQKKLDVVSNERMKRTKTSAKKNTQEAGSSQLEKQRPKKWDKSDTTHYNNMKKVAVPATQLACPETMTILGIKADIEGLFQNMGLGQLCNLKEPTYPELVRQFIASAYVTRPDDSHQEGFLAFVVQKVYYEVSFTDLCGLFGLSAGERTYGLYWTSELLNFWETIGTGVYRSSQAKESLIRSPVLRYATRLIGSLLYGTTTAASVTQWELCLLYQGVRHLLPAFGNSTFPPATAFNMGAVLAANLAGYKGKVTKSKSNACGFGAVITRILRHVGVDCENQQVALDRSNNIAWNYLDVISLVSKEFIAGPHSRIHRDGPYVYVFQDRAKKTLYCHLPQIGLTALLSEAAVEFLPPATALVDKPSFFTPKYQTKGKGVVDEEGQDEAAQAIPDDSQPHQLLPSDSSQYKLQELPPNATSRQQQHWRDQSIKTNNDMLHKIWAAISRIRPCRCQKDDVVHRDNSPSSSGSGSSGTHMVRKRSKRPNDAGTSGAGDEE